MKLFKLFCLALMILQVACKVQSPKQEVVIKPVSPTVPVITHKPMTIDSSYRVLASVMFKQRDSISSSRLTGNIDRDFINLLITHIQGATAIAKHEMQYGEKIELIFMARDMVPKYLNAIKDLDSLKLELASRAPKATAQVPKDMRPKTMASDNIKRLKTLPIDQQFANLMINYQEDGIAITRSIGKYAQSEDLKAIAKSIAEDKTKNIENLMQWLRIHVEKQ